MAEGARGVREGPELVLAPLGACRSACESNRDEETSGAALPSAEMFHRPSRARTLFPRNGELLGPITLEVFKRQDNRQRSEQEGDGDRLGPDPAERRRSDHSATLFRRSTEASRSDRRSHNIEEEPEEELNERGKQKERRAALDIRSKQNRYRACRARDATVFCDRATET